VEDPACMTGARPRSVQRPKSPVAISANTEAEMDPDQKLTANKRRLRTTEQPAADLPHAVRTRLAIITLLSGNLDILYDCLDDDKRREMIRDLRTHAHLLNKLVCDILEAPRA